MRQGGFGSRCQAVAINHASVSHVPPPPPLDDWAAPVSHGTHRGLGLYWSKNWILRSLSYELCRVSSRPHRS
jgi:hypothetical protein